MTGDDGDRLGAVFGAAMKLDAGRRAEFIREACGGDDRLRAEIESLLKHEEQLGSFLDQPAIEAVAASMAERTLVGQMLGPYKIETLLGAGGMGMVYRARDTRLGRPVAIKLAAKEFGGRFLTEARAVAALNHPRVCTLYDIGPNYLVMELVEGETLAARLRMGVLPLPQVVQYAIEIADALAAAHARGIIHRDLKPGNIMITQAGIKMLDFGLAKRVAVGVSAGSEVPTVSMEQAQRTVPGLMLGTVPYMSPEQVRAKQLDARTDLFSFGVVLYQMATGKLPFQGETSGVICSEILTGNPQPASQLNPKVSPDLEGIIHRALEKDRELRYQHAADMRSALQRLERDSPPLPSAQETGAASTATKRVGILAATVACVAALVVAGYFVSHRPPKFTDKDTVVLADFDNRTGDPVFDDTLKQGLSVQLEQSPFLDLVSERKVNNTLKLMGHAAGDRLTPEVTREVCERTGSKAMLTSSIAGLGTQYVIGLKVVNCDTGDVLAEAQEQAAGKESVLKALDTAAVGLRSKLGESLRSVHRYATPLEEATTPSLEALKAYGMGQKMRSAKGETAALPFFNRAVEIDPNFAMAYANLAWCYSTRNELERAAENARKAYELREKVSERERFFIVANYYQTATGELEKAAQTYELWQQTYRRDDVTYFGLGSISSLLGNHEKALEEDLEAMRLDPNNWINYSGPGNDYQNLNRLDEAETVYKQAQERKLEDAFLLLARHQLAFLKGDTAQMARLVAAAMGKLGTEDVLLASQADTEAWYGKLRNAREMTRRAMDSAQRNDAKETAAGYQAAEALREVASGNRQQAVADADTAVKLAPNRQVQVMAALALALAGNTAAAERLAAELDKKFPLDTLVQRYWLPSIRAAIALDRKNPKQAIELLSVSSAIELAAPTTVTVALCPAYLRGEGYLMLHDGKAAAAEFQKFMDHRGLVANFPLGALARLGLARAYALDAAKNGDRLERARAAYKNFLALWNDADPSIPILVQAQAEYAKVLQLCKYQYRR